MKRVIAAAALAAAIAGSASAQTTPTPPATTPPAAGSGTTTTPMNTPTAPMTTTTPMAAPAAKANDPGAPLPGANSFTEAQARTRVEERGYTNVTGLAKDADGIWRGKATKDGKVENVSVDYRGNIVIGSN